MDDKTYTITLSNGTVLENLSLNGNNFISNDTIKESTFIGGCSPVVINDGETDETHENMALVQVIEMNNGEYWFILRDLSSQEIAASTMRADIDFLAMMADVEL